jgi:prepilin-type N-terminal cleavage/methylation domain-containing protein
MIIPSRKMRNQNGVTFIELLITMLILGIAGSAILGLFISTTISYKNIKSASDNATSALPEADIVGKYLDRWGAGVPFRRGETSASNFPPPDPKSIVITNVDANYDTVSFYGNMFGFGMVVNTATTAPNVAGCRLSSANSSKANCYYVWDNLSVVNPGFGTLQNPLDGNVPNALTLPELSPNDTTCEDITAANVTLTSMNLTSNPSGPSVTLKSGNIIHRAPYRVTLSVKPNTQDGNRNWLFADLADMAAECGNDMTNIALVPVDKFKVTVLPAGCDTVGTSVTEAVCTAIQVDMTVRSTTVQYSGRTYNTFNIARVYGR